MGLVSSFKSYGHAIAAGSKYFATHLVPEAFKIASKVQAIQPEADAILGLIAGPQAVAINDIACNILGEVANALALLSQDQLAAVQSNGLNLKLDQSVVQDVKSFALLVENLLKARGTTPPSPVAK